VRGGSVSLRGATLGSSANAARKGDELLATLGHNSGLMTQPPPPLDVEAILTPIPGDSPAGKDLRYSTLHDDIRRRRRAIQDKAQIQVAVGTGDFEFEDMFDPGGPSREETLQAICRDTVAALTHESKDLQLAAWLLEAQTRLNGFSGAASVLELIREMIDRCWATLYPLPDPDDDEPIADRVAVLEWIGARLPEWLRAIPLNDTSSGESWSLADYLEVLEREAQRRKLGPFDDARSLERFRQAMHESGREHLDRVLSTLASCREQVQSLETITDVRCVEDWIGPDGRRRQRFLVGFREIIMVLDDCARVVMGALRSTQPEPTPTDVDDTAVERVNPDERRDGRPRATPHIPDAMYSALAEFRTGSLGVAVAELTRALASSPNDRAMNVMLFTLLCFEGDFDGAGRQLDLLSVDFHAHKDSTGVERGLDIVAELVRLSDVYRNVLAAEARRRDVFHGSGLPQFLSPPPACVEAYLRLVKTLQTDKSDAAMALESIESATPAVTGELSAAADCLDNHHLWFFGFENASQPFSSIRDADDRLAAVLEVFHEAEYFWVPISQVVQLTIAGRTPLLEELWLKARLTVVDRPALDVFLPAVYIDSALHPNVKAGGGAATEWTVIDNRMVVGAGHRMFLVDGQQVRVADIGTITIAP